MGLCIWKYDPTEYFQIKLNEKLVQGATYEFKIFVNYDPNIKDCLLDSVTEMGCYFSDTSIYLKNKTQLYFKPHVIIPLDNNIYWVEKKGCYVAKGNEEYLIIGKYFDSHDNPKDCASIRLRNLQNQRLDSIEFERETKIAALDTRMQNKYETDLNDFNKTKSKAKREKKMKEFRINVSKMGLEIRSAISDIEKQYQMDIENQKMENYCRIRINIDDIALTRTNQQIITTIIETPVAGEIVRLKNIFFKTDQSELLVESFVELDKLYLMLQNNESIKIEISGHTDNTGNEKHNQHLSEMRAYAVVYYLISKGIDKARISNNGLGSTTPITSNNTAEGRAENRRVEFKVIKY